MPAQSPSLASTDVLRNAELSDLSDLLKKQIDVRYDVVVSASNLHFSNGVFAIEGGASRLSDEVDPETGFPVEVPGDAYLRPTAQCETQVAERFKIPPKYLRRLREEAVFDAAPHGHDQLLLDETVNAHLAQDPDRKFLLRGFRTDDGSEGIARALLSNRYKIVDNLDVLLAALDGVRHAGVPVEIEGCDLTDRNMQVRVACPAVRALAPKFLANYRSPFREDHGGVNGGWTLERARSAAAIEGKGYTPGDEPVVFAGFVIGNSETGGGRSVITPRIICGPCTNGLQIAVDAFGMIHLGGALDDGVIEWSAETRQRDLELVRSQTRDAVAKFLDEDYLLSVISRVEEKCDAPVREPVKLLERVAKQFGFTEAEQETILSGFVSSGQSTAGGVLQAVTATAQTVQDPDRASELESCALDVLDFVAAAA